jgi:uncharacterized phage-like protein YoqJ
MIICGTGHRPDKLGGYDSITHNRLIRIAEQYLLKLKPEKVISGMALGWDTALAEATLNLNIYLCAAIPFAGQENMWPKDSQTKYKEILSRATYVKEVCDKGYAPYKMQIRNEWMVDNSDLVLAMWNGTKGGTYNCIQYAKKKNKQIINAYKDFLVS